MNKSFRLLTEYHSFLLKTGKDIIFQSYNSFPSPYGVSFILIHDLDRYQKEWLEFPSPYGVSFILIFSEWYKWL